MGRALGHDFERRPTKDYPRLVWIKLAKRFQKKKNFSTKFV